MGPRVATFLALHWTSAGCRESSSAEQSEGDEGCGYEDREVSLDARFGDETPGEVIELLERAVDGRLTWYGGSGMHVDVGGVSGETEFHAQVSFLGPVVWVREGIEGMGGILEDRLVPAEERPLSQTAGVPGRRSHGAKSFAIAPGARLDSFRMKPPQPIDYSPTVNRILSWAGILLFIVIMIVAWTSDTDEFGLAIRLKLQLTAAAFVLGGGLWAFARRSRLRAEAEAREAECGFRAIVNTKIGPS